MSRISRVDRSELPPDIADLFDKVFAQRGNVPNMFRVMAHRPEIFSTMQAHFAAVLHTGTVPTRLKELIIVRTSQLNQTPYCLASHTILARKLGWTDEQLANLAGWSQRNDFTAAEKAAIRLAETVTRDAHSLSDEQFAELPNCSAPLASSTTSIASMMLCGWSRPSRARAAPSRAAGSSRLKPPSQLSPKVQPGVDSKS